MRQILLFVTLSVMTLGVFAQAPADGVGIAVKADYGYILAHRPVMRHLVQGHVSGLELSYERKGRGRQPWHDLYNNPTYGVALYRADLGNKEQLGGVTGIYPFLNFPLAGNSYFRWKLRVSSGLGIVDKPFDQEENQKNVAIGSRVNALIGFRTEAELRLRPVRISLGMGFTHLSNAAAVAPNLGLNIPSVYLGLKWEITPHTKLAYVTIVDDTTTPPPPQQKSLFMLASLGYKQTNPPGGKTYLTYTLSGNFFNDYGRKSSWTAGLDLMYNSSLLFRYREDVGSLNSDLQVLQAGINAGYTLRVGKFDLFIQQGIYLLDQYKGDGLLYNRIGYRYRWNDRWMAVLRLKAHLSKADYLEYAIAWRLK